MPPRQRRPKAVEKADDVLPVPQTTEPVQPQPTDRVQEDVDTMPPIWVPPKILPEIVHPSCIGYQRSTFGLLLNNPSLIHPAMAGAAWKKTQPVISQDPRSNHIATFGYYESTKPEDQGLDDAFDPAITNPIFAHPGLRLLPPYVQEVPPEYHPSVTPVIVSSSQGLFLTEKVWPMLARGLDCMLKAVKKKASKEAVGRQIDPAYPLDHVSDFDAIKWLAQYLKRYNPNTPPRFTREGAACKIQSVFRGHRVRTHAARLREARRKVEAAAAEVRRRNEAATTIQSTYRGHRVRVYLAMGKRLDGLPVVERRGKAPGASGPMTIFVS